jgi:hypothetical protein
MFPGFRIRVKPPSGARSYIVQYRNRSSSASFDQTKNKRARSSRRLCAATPLKPGAPRESPIGLRVHGLDEVGSVVLRFGWKRAHCFGAAPRTHDDMMGKGRRVMPQPWMPECGERRGEPEIYSPTRRVGRPADSESGIRIFVMGRTRSHTYFAKLGLLTVIIAAIVLGALSAITLLIVLGVFLIWIPVIGLLFAVLSLPAYLAATRGFRRR